jgi:hypothetical protein
MALLLLTRTGLCDNNTYCFLSTRETVARALFLHRKQGAGVPEKLAWKRLKNGGKNLRFPNEDKALGTTGWYVFRIHKNSFGNIK